MTLDDEHMTAAQDRREALEEDRRRDLAEQLHELRLRDETETIEAEESKWRTRFKGSAKHYSSRQLWDGTT